MSKFNKIGIVIYGAIILSLLSFLSWSLLQPGVAILQPKGVIADEQYKLLIFTLILSAIVVVPVFILATVIALKYREGNTKNPTYDPKLKDNSRLEMLWWGVPCVIIFILAVVTWTTSHSLDPYKKIESTEKPLEVQVISLRWKWLFIYPDQQVASVNEMQFPEKTPVHLTLTSDAPMNAFWIPELGSQIYAMSGMSSQLSLMANSTGSYVGKSSNLSGEGFARMNFTAKSVTKETFETWTRQARQASSPLNMKTYNKLVEPSIEKNPKVYSLQDGDLFDAIVKKNMSHQMPQDTEHQMHGGGR